MPAVCMQARKGPESQVVVIGGHVMVAHRLLDDPRVAEIDGFVTAEEAAYLIDLAHQTGLKKSHVVCMRCDGMRCLDAAPCVRWAKAAWR
jgi:hypothetical protein